MPGTLNRSLAGPERQAPRSGEADLLRLLPLAKLCSHSYRSWFREQALELHTVMCTCSTLKSLQLVWTTPSLSYTDSDLVSLLLRKPHLSGKERTLLTRTSPGLSPRPAPTTPRTILGAANSKLQHEKARRHRHNLTLSCL